VPHAQKANSFTWNIKLNTQLNYFSIKTARALSFSKPKFLDVKSHNLYIFDKLCGLCMFCTHVNYIKTLVLYGINRYVNSMHIDIIPNRNSRPSILLRESWRENDKVMKRTLANISDWPPEKVAALRRVLKNEPLVSPGEVFSIERSLPHGHVEAILEMICHIGFDKMIASRRTRERDLVLAIIVERLIAPSSKLATTRLWHSTTLAQLLNVQTP